MTDCNKLPHFVSKTANPVMSRDTLKSYLEMKESSNPLFSERMKSTGIILTLKDLRSAKFLPRDFLGTVSIADDVQYQSHDPKAASSEFQNQVLVTRTDAAWEKCESLTKLNSSLLEKLKKMKESYEAKILSLTNELGNARLEQAELNAHEREKLQDQETTAKVLVLFPSSSAAVEIDGKTLKAPSDDDLPPVDTTTKLPFSSSSSSSSSSTRESKDQVQKWETRGRLTKDQAHESAVSADLDMVVDLLTPAENHHQKIGEMIAKETAFCLNTAQSAVESDGNSASNIFKSKKTKNQRNRDKKKRIGLEQQDIGTASEPFIESDLILPDDTDTNSVEVVLLPVDIEVEKEGEMTIQILSSVSIDCTLQKNNSVIENYLEDVVFITVEVEEEEEVPKVEPFLSDVDLLKQQVKQMALQLTELTANVTGITANMNSVLGRLEVLEDEGK